MRRTILLSILAALALMLTLNRQATTLMAAGVGGTIDGTVLGTDGRAVAQMTVKLFEGGTGKNHKPLQTATTDDAGKFTFSDLEPGDYVIVAGGKGTAHGRAKTHVVPSGIANVTVGLASHRHK